MGKDTRELMAQVEEALDAGRSKVARALATELVTRSPEVAAAWALKAAAHAQCGEPGPAEEAFDEALERDPDDLEILLAWTDFLICQPGNDLETLEAGVDEARRGQKLAREAKEPGLEAEFALLLGVALNQAGDHAGALSALDDAAKLAPPSVEVKLERGFALWDLCRFDEAEDAFRAVCKQSPEEPWAHHHLGLLAERKHAKADAARHFAEARRLAPDEFPETVTLQPREFEKLVEDAIREIPADFRGRLENLRLTVEPLPSTDDLLCRTPPFSPGLLGIFHGTPLGKRSVWHANDFGPTQIKLFQLNLQRQATTREALIEQVRVTVLHELGHLVGLDEDDLAERGLD